MLKHTIETQKLEAKKQEFTLKVNYLQKSIEGKKDIKNPKGLEK